MLAGRSALRSAVSANRCFQGRLSNLVAPVKRAVSVNAGAKAGDYVAVHYTGTLDDGSVFDTSRENNRDPLEFQIGAGRVIKGFDMAVTGLEVGGTRKVRLDPADAYGEHDPQMVLQVPADKAPPGLQAGVRVQLNNGMPALVKEVTKEAITLDLNHELAGKPLTFDVQLMSLWPADRLQTAAFGAGCFWGVELAFQRVPGVVSTEVGYSNGEKPKVTYEEVCQGNTGHAEVVKVLYDPAEVTFEQLLDVFWEKHDPTTLNRQGGDTGTQYRSGVYCTTEEQKEVAKQSMEKAQLKFKDKIVTEIDSLKLYNPAEDYHQQYLAKGGRFGRPQSTKKMCNDPIRCYG